MNNLESLKYFLPEIVLVGGAVFVVLFDLIAGRRKLIPYITLWVLVVSFYVSANMLAQGVDSSLFEGTVRLNGFTLFFKLLFCVAAGLTVLFSISKQKEHQGIEYYALLLISTLGLFILSSANDLLMIYLGLETVSICSYLLVASLKGTLKSSEAGLKYVIYGAMASGIMIFGMALFYGLYGTLSLPDLANAVTNTPKFGPGILTLSAALFMVFVGFGYKIAAVPVHMWCPDVYEGAPTEITAFLSVAPKAAGFAILIRFFFNLIPAVPELNIPNSAQFQNYWQTIMAVISVLTMTVGNLAALHQTNLKRLLAYSSIAHAGYILMGLVVLTQGGMQAMVLYLPIYLFMNMGAFFVVYIIERLTGQVDISEYEGLGWRMPFLGVLMAIFLFSLVGLPPLAGFIGKLYLFAAVIDAHWYKLAILGVLNGVVSLYYYARIVKAMWLNVPETAAPGAPRSALNAFDVILLLIFVIPVFVLGVWFTPLIQIINKALGLH
ncbi:MAG: NADH-quinone oxidoreductase subunit N [Planctomycetes bacterium]|nr:NADH-quinone oxidoreductase subunit N [Planctomycetota bacterium]